MKTNLGSWSFIDGYASSVPRLFLRTIMAWGSVNAILTGLGFVRNFGGLDKITVHGKGSTQFFQTDNNFAGLGDQATYGKGSVFKVQRVLALTGEGPVRFGGEDIGVTADSTLQYVKKALGVFVGPALPASQARPSSQTIYPKNTPGAGFTGMDGSVCTVIWRIDSNTGQPSLSSLASNVLLLTGQSVIQPFPATDTAQDYWGIGVCKPGFGTAPIFYELKTDLGGEVAESTLSYSREITGHANCTNADATLTLDGGTPVDERFTAADVGRRVFMSGAVDSWIVSVTDAFNAEMNDDATATLASDDLTITHAVNGILRAVEISWTTESLAGQELAPFDAYPAPANLRWAGIINDAMFVETDDGIIYVGVVGFIGSYPPKNTLFPSEPATLYLDGSDGLYWRFSKNKLQALTYVGGEKPLELQTVWMYTGILFPQNAAIGKGGRVIAWSGKPVRLGAGIEPDIEFAFKVYKDFEGWNDQTAEMPVICVFDPENQFECWAYNRKIMCVRGGTDIWCAPIDVSGYMADGEYLISGVIVGNKLRFATNAGTELSLYHFDEGEGSRMVIQTSDIESPLESDTITEVKAVVHVDETDSIALSIIKNFHDEIPIPVQTYIVGNSPANQTLLARPNIINARQHCVKIEIESAGRQVGVQKIDTLGEPSNIFFRDAVIERVLLNLPVDTFDLVDSIDQNGGRIVGEFAIADEIDLDDGLEAGGGGISALLAIGDELDLEDTPVIEQVTRLFAPDYLGNGYQDDFSGTGVIWYDPSSFDYTPYTRLGMAEGDIVLIFCETNTAETPSILSGAGWTQAPNSPVTNSAGTKLSVFWKRVVTEESPVTFANIADHLIGTIVGFRGCIATGNPFDATAQSTGNNSSTTDAITVPSITTSEANEMVVMGTSLSGYNADVHGDNDPIYNPQNASLAEFPRGVSYHLNVGDNGGVSVRYGVKEVAGTVDVTTQKQISPTFPYASWIGSLKGSTTAKPHMVDWWAGVENIFASGGAQYGRYPAVKPNDIAFVFTEKDSVDATCSTAGWSLIDGMPVNKLTATPTRLSGFWRRIDGTEEVNPASTPTRWKLSNIIALRGCVPTGDPFDVAAQGTGSGTSISVPGVTTSVANCLALNAVGVTGLTTSTSAFFSGWTNASLSGVTERWDSAGNVRTSGSGAEVAAIGFATGGKAVAGAVSATTVTGAASGQTTQWMGAVKGSSGVPTIVNVTNAFAGVTRGGYGTTGLPASLAADDVLVMMLTNPDVSDIEVLFPDGWTEAPNSPVINSDPTNPCVMHIFWKRTSGVLLNPSLNTSNASAGFARGCIESGNPWDVTATNTGTGTAITAPSIITSQDKSLVVNALCSTRNSAFPGATFHSPVNTNLSQFVLGGDMAAFSSGVAGYASGIKDVAGATGTTTLTQETAVDWCAWTGALKPKT